MTNSLKILGSCRIAENKIIANQKLVFSQPTGNFPQFAEAAYKNQGLAYPRFYKMNNLSKLGFLAAEYLLGNFVERPPIPLSGDLTGIVLANHYSSIDTDLKHQQLMQQGIASPAVFVYTLPNSVIGELCIRHRMQGENTFFLSSDYDIPAQVAYVSQLFRQHLVAACFVGWVEYTAEGYQAFLALIAPSSDEALAAYSPSNLTSLFHQSHGPA